MGHKTDFGNRREGGEKRGRKGKRLELSDLRLDAYVRVVLNPFRWSLFYACSSQREIMSKGGKRNCDEKGGKKGGSGGSQIQFWTPSPLLFSLSSLKNEEGKKWEKGVLVSTGSPLQLSSRFKRRLLLLASSARAGLD